MAMVHRILLSLAFLFMTCPVWADWAALLPPGAAFVLPPTSGGKILKQCSRAAPQDVSEFWQPTAEQISLLEKLLTSYLSHREKTGAFIPPKYLPYHRQYVGITKGNVRLIYGNFYPMRETSTTEASIPVLICDGGPAFWGIVFDPSTDSFEEPNFNGPA